VNSSPTRWTDLSRQLSVSPARPPELGPVSPDRSSRLRELLERHWRRHLTAKTVEQGLAAAPGAPVRRGWNVQVRLAVEGAPVGCEGLVLHDQPGSVALELPPDWGRLYTHGWAMCGGLLLISVAEMDGAGRPTVALVGRWSLRDDPARGGWKAILAPWWAEIAHLSHGPKVELFDSDRMAGMPVPWPMGW
jgi:hypothetical protein